MKSTHLAGALCSFLLICANPTLAADQTPDQLEQIKLKSAKWGVAAQQATALTRAAKYQGAEKIYKQIIAERQALYWPYLQRAIAYTAMGQYKPAISDYSTLVERAPEDGDYYECRAAVYVKAGDLTNGLDDYNHLITLSPKYPVGYRERAKIYEKMDGKKSPRAVSDYAIVKKLGY